MTVTFENLPVMVAELRKDIYELRTLLKQKPEPPTEDPLSGYITRKEAKEFLNIKADATIWRWEKLGKIKRYTISGKVYYKVSELVGSIENSKK